MTNAFSTPSSFLLLDDVQTTSATNYNLLCFHNATYNLLHLKEHRTSGSQLPHRLAAGALTTTRFNLFGSSGITNPSFWDTNPTDSHCWIEDRDGNIWDFITPEAAERINNMSKRPIISTHGAEIRGLSPKTILSRYGLMYHNAPHKQQLKIYMSAWTQYIPFKERPDLMGFIYIRTFLDIDDNTTTKHPDRLKEQTWLLKELGMSELLDLKHDRTKQRTFFNQAHNVPTFKNSFTLFVRAGKQTLHQETVSIIKPRFHDKMLDKCFTLDDMDLVTGR